MGKRTEQQLAQELLVKLKQYYGDDRGAIVRRLQDGLNIPFAEAKQLLENHPKKEFNGNHNPKNGQFSDGEDTANSIDFDAALAKYQSFADSTNMPSYTFDPVSGNGYNAFDSNDATQLLQKFTDGKSDLYFVATTNHAGPLTRESHSAFIQVQNSGNQPLVGYWKSDDTGVAYTDISYPLDHGAKDSDASKLRLKYAQERIIVLRQNGKVALI